LRQFLEDLMIRPALAAAFTFSAAAAVAHPAMTVYDTTMRAAPSGHARVVQRIPGRAQIDVGECGEDWCAASWRDIDGFVRVDAVGPNEGALRERRPYYGGPVIVAPLFGFGYYRRW
jgi:uncharacterized protein YraI